MSFKVRKGNTEIEAESVADVRELLIMLGEIQPPSENGPGKKGDPNAPIADRLLRIRERIERAEQVKVLEVLAQAPDWMKDSDLVAAAGLESTRAIAGITQALTKYAKAEGVDTDHVYLKQTHKTDEGKRSYAYRLTPDMREVMKLSGKKRANVGG